MGNAAITIHHPTSLDHGVPYLESGKIVASTTSMLRLEKRDGAAVGCGGRVVFKKTVLESYWTYRITKENSAHFQIGYDITVKAAEKKEAEAKLVSEYGMSWAEVRECVAFVKSKIDDSNSYSELYCYVNYAGKNVGEVYWTKNDLDLDYDYRWAEDSEMIIDVTFNDKYRNVHDHGCHIL